MPNVSSKSTELKVIALLLKSPIHIRALDIDLRLFETDSHRLLVSLIKEYVTKYKEPPTVDSLKNFANNKITDDESVADLVDALQLLFDLPTVEKEEAVYYFDKLHEYKLGRDLFDISEFFRIEYNKPDTEFSKLREDLIKRLLLAKQNEPGIVRGNIFTKENIIKNFEDYKKATRQGNPDLVPYGIKCMDDALGGMLKGTLTLIYSAANVGKSIFGINLAYNSMLNKKRVLYISLEMSHSYLSKKFYSRASLLDSKDILFGRLQKEQLERYVSSTKKFTNIESDVYIVDISESCTCNTIRAELENYIHQNGIAPDLVIVDHVGQMELAKGERSSDRSYIYDVIFKNLQKIARYYHSAFLVMFHTSRKAMLEEIAAMQKGNDLVEGTHNIAESQAIGKHVDVSIRLRQTEIEKRANKLMAIPDKSRFTDKLHRFMLNAYLPLTYIGEDKING